MKLSNNSIKSDKDTVEKFFLDNYVFLEGFSNDFLQVSMGISPEAADQALSILKSLDSLGIAWDVFLQLFYEKRDPGTLWRKAWWTFKAL